MMASKSEFLVLGATGWIGHYLIAELKTYTTGITGLSRANAGNGIFAAVNSMPPATIINLARGETDQDFLLHQQLIELQNSRSERYLYASSFNAVDAELLHAHKESDLAHAQSEYGKFKARCEAELLKSCKRPLIFRFGATHGWAPNRIARTQEFLAKLQTGEEIRVDRGVIQNRSFVGDLATQIAMLAAKADLEGVFHLGTDDAGEEIDFLKNLAEAFDYPAAQVHEGEKNDCNAFMMIEGLKKAYPAYIVPKQIETIQKVAAQKELQRFKRKKSHS